MKTNEIKSLVADIESLNDRITTLKWDEYNKIESELYNRLEEIANSSGDGFAVGKNIHFGVVDGSAQYIITKVRKNDVVVEHLPFGDAYTFSGCYLNNKNELVIPRQVAERAFNMDKSLKDIFSKP